MKKIRAEDIRKRQAQWEAFNRWESGHVPEPISVDERLAWYAAAFDFSRKFVKPATLTEMEEKVQHIRDLRERLAHLK